MEVQLLSRYDWLLISKKISENLGLLEITKNDLKSVGELRKEVAFLESCYDLKKNIEVEMLKYKNIDFELCSTTDDEMRSLLILEKDSIKTVIESYSKELEDKTFQNNEIAERSAFLEIRAGTGGQEASLFVSDLARMYTMYGQKKNWMVSVVDVSPTEVGGFREIVLHIEGKNVFQYLAFEAGVHRVQRVPATENAGRVHTSTVTVAVLPEAEEVEINIEAKDIRIDTYRASGAGGQHVNKTDSAVRITHIATNLVVTCQDERSQHKNRAKAMKILQARLFALEKEKQDSAVSKIRKDMVSTAERSEKIRTYNYPQNRITDHRGNVTLSQLDFIMNGNMDPLLLALLEQDTNDKVVNPYLTQFIK